MLLTVENGLERPIPRGRQNIIPRGKFRHRFSLLCFEDAIHGVKSHRCYFESGTDHHPERSSVIIPMWLLEIEMSWQMINFYKLGYRLFGFIVNKLLCH